MSGQPNWAKTEESAVSTMEWMMDCVDDDVDVIVGGTVGGSALDDFHVFVHQRRGVAGDFGAMSQFGCVVAFACNFSGSCSAMRCIRARSTSLNAPPEAVKIILRNAPGVIPYALKQRSVRNHVGKIFTPFFQCQRHNRRTTAIKVPLFAKQMFSRVYRGHRRQPAHPTIPVTTASAISCAPHQGDIPSFPYTNSGIGPLYPLAFKVSFNFSISFPSCTETICG